MSFLHRFAPRASRRTRLLVAALMWTGIGAGLVAAGLHWLLAASSRLWLASLPVALAAGWAKGRFLLGRRADANAERIVAAGDDRCLGGVFSWASWAVAGSMMVGGWVLRHSSLLPRPWLGCLYTAIGAALLVASFGSWSRWHRFGGEDAAARRL